MKYHHLTMSNWIKFYYLVNWLRGKYWFLGIITRNKLNDVFTYALIHGITVFIRVPLQWQIVVCLSTYDIDKTIIAAYIRIPSCIIWSTVTIGFYNNLLLFKPYGVCCAFYNLKTAISIMCQERLSGFLWDV